FEEFGIDTTRLMTDGGEEMPEGYAEGITEAVDEYEGDPRVAAAEFHDSENGTAVPDVRSRERDWDSHEGDYDEEAMGHAIRALTIMDAQRHQGDVDPRLTEAQESEFGHSVPDLDNEGINYVGRGR
ncbi:MAG: hypothetical protein ABEJ72_07245, partial [Candidatus Aenigmatarchaeota archaeon]